MFAASVAFPISAQSQNSRAAANSTGKPTLDLFKFAHQPVHAVRSAPREHRVYSVENVALETVPRYFNFGNLYRPLGSKDIGAIVLVPFEAGRDELQIVCAHLARMGATVFRYDATAADSTLRLWNEIRALDFISGLERVDPSRVGVLGESADQRVTADNVYALEKNAKLDPAKRKAIYDFFARRLEIRRNGFNPFRERQPDALEIIPEDLKRIIIESAETLRAIDKSAGTTFKNESEIAVALQKHLTDLRKNDQSKSEPPRSSYTFKTAGPDDERIIFTPPGFDQPGQAKVASGAEIGTVEVSVIDETTDQPTFCRINVVGPDGHYYEPAKHDLKRYSFTGVWPKSGWGNRQTKAPIRYLGRYFYSNGRSTPVKVPSGVVRIEVWKGFEYTPTTLTTHVTAGQVRRVQITLRKGASVTGAGWWSGDPHIHIQRFTEADDQRILDLMEAEDIRFGSVLAYNNPAGWYYGFMKRMEAPQMRGLGRRSMQARGGYWILSGEEYRSGTYGHLNLFLVDDLILPGSEHNANNWPPYGHVVEKARKAGGIAFYAHGGYAQEVYADVAQGKIDGVELLQFGVYRGIGLDDWYHMLNTGFRVPINGAADYPACRKLGDCKTYVHSGKEPNPEGWLRGMAAGRSFVTSGPMLLLDVDGIKPGGRIDKQGPVRVKAKIRVRSEVAPVTNLRLIANGRVLHELTVPRSAGRGSWIELEREIELKESAWIAARAWSFSATGTPDAEAHTNPVYVYLDGKAPYDVTSLDTFVAKLDRQIDIHQKRKFDERKQVLAYFQRSRDILMKLRAAGGAPSTGHPSDLAQADASLNIDPGQREHTDEELEAFLKPMPAKPIDEVMRSFETANGFEMQLVAREPLVYDPIAAAFDEWGNLYACEMRDYPYKPKAGGKPMGTLRLLRDTDGDGNFDESHVFADGLLWAGGVAPWKGGVYVTAPPDIWYLKDTDGDHRADVRERVFTGFGTGNQQAMLNNLIWGLDHKIYGATAGNGGEVQTDEQNPINVRGRDFRFDPATREFETISGSIQFGNTFDDWGNRFVCSQAQPLLHVVLPRRYLERNKHVSMPGAINNIARGPVPIFRSSPLERWRQIRSSRRVAHGARKATDTGASHHVVDSAAGVTIYRGGAYPAEYYGNTFVGDAQNNYIHRRALTPDGVTFKSHRTDQSTEFVRSTDNWFRPVNFVNAPDGTLYALDMSREIIETIHVPLDVMKFIDVIHGRNHGRIYRIAPPGFRYPGPPRLGEATTADLVKHFESPHGWFRDTAHRLIFERQDRSVVPALRNLLINSAKPEARLHALWSLQGLDSLQTADRARALQDPDAHVREHAIRLCEPHLDDHIQQLSDLTKDSTARIQFQLAFSLGFSSDPRAAMALSEIARKHIDDQWIRTAVLSSVSESADHVFAELSQDDKFRQSSTGRGFLDDLLKVVASRGRPAEITRALQSIAAVAKTDEAIGIQLLSAFAEPLRRAGKNLSPALVNDSTLAGFLRASIATAQDRARNRKAGVTSRLAAMKIVTAADFATARETLAAALEPTEPEAIQLAAVKALTPLRDPEIAAMLLKHWRNAPPAVRIQSSLALLGRTDRTEAFLQAIDSGQASASAIDLSRRPLLLKHKRANVRKLAAKLFGTTDSNRAKVITDYQSILRLKADPKRGRSIFQKACMACHRVDNLGIEMGPDIASNASKDPKAWLVHVLDPNRYVDPRYESYLCETKNGETHTGMLTAQTATSITLNRLQTVLRTDIVKLTSTGKSLMPEGLEAVIPKQDMADLFAWLKSTGKKPLHIGTVPGLIEPEKAK
ncbi:MAG: dehydrogenase [Verrucomicrobiales bacterium]|nr:dehydrogenase [Verrucomicrobiales bacterium]